MSRTRYIKPGFFENERLAECTPLARILFAGLWCWADREGRLEERPKRIKAQILPYDDCDIISLLGELQKQGFIRRYEVDGEKYLVIPQFATHQNPHRHEPPSRLPSPLDGITSTTIVGTPPDIVRSGYDNPSIPKPHGEWGMGNGEWGSRTQTPPSEFEHPIWGDGASSNDDDDIAFRKICDDLEITGQAYQERGLIELLAEYKDEPDPVGEAARWRAKKGGEHNKPGGRLGSFRLWLEVERVERKKPKTASGAQRVNSTTSSSTTEYVMWNTPITTDIPQFMAFFEAVRSTGQCEKRIWKALEGLGKQVKGDGTLLFIASDEQEKRKIERDYRRRISSGCRDAGLTFEIACGA